MATTTLLPLEGLTQRITDQQAELLALQKELEIRQGRLAKLAERKEQLTQRLRQLDADIEAVSQGKTLSRAVAKAPAVKPEAASTQLDSSQGKSATPSANQPPKRMADLIVDIVAEKKGPISAKPIAEELQERGFFRKSPNLPRIVQARINDLVHERVLRRADGQPGVVLATAKAQPSGSAGKTAGRKKGAVSRQSSSTGRNGQKQVPLRSILTDILGKSQRPLTARELADQAIAKGYVTKSKSFIDVLWVVLGKMDNVKNVPGQGYRLKSR